MDPADIENRRGRFASSKLYKHTTVNYDMLAEYGLEKARSVLALPEWAVLRPKEPTYKNLTLEFLTTVHDPDLDEESIRFRLRNRWHTLSTGALNAAFGTPENGEESIVEGPDDFWPTIGKRRVDWRAGVVVNKKIQCPDMRFMQYIIARTIFARGESPEKISTQDLTLLWSMVHRMAVDVAHLWRGLILTRVEREKPGDITVGPYITLIARHVGALDSTRGLEKPDATLYRPLTEHVMATWKFEKVAPPGRDEDDIFEDDDDDGDDLPPPPPAAPQPDVGASSSRRRTRDTWDMSALEGRLTGIETTQAALRDSFTSQQTWMHQAFDQFTTWHNDDVRRWEQQQLEMKRMMAHAVAQENANRTLTRMLGAMAANRPVNVHMGGGNEVNDELTDEESDPEDVDYVGDEEEDSEDGEDDIDDEMSEGETSGGPNFYVEGEESDDEGDGGDDEC